MTRPPVTSGADKEYVRSEFVELTALCVAVGRHLIEVREEYANELRPNPTYIFDDGTEFVASNYFTLETDRSRFESRLIERASSLLVERPDVDTIWADYISGAYGICLVEVTPENIVAKDFLITRITQLTGGAAPMDRGWREELRRCVDSLDTLERPFCAYDREVFQGPVSRDIFITRVRERYL